MFDSLKEKLGSFRDDVEETAEEKAEPVEEGETDAETPNADPEAELPETDPDVGVEGTDATTGAGTEPDSEAEPGSGERADLDAESGTDEPDPGRESAPVAGPGESGPTPAGETETDAESADATAAAADSGTAVEDAPEGGSEPSIDPDHGVAGEDDLTGEAEAATHDGEVSADADESEGGDDPEEDVEESNATGFGRKARSLVRGKFVIEEEDVEEPLEDLELALLSSDVEMGVTEEILENIREELIGETRRFRESTGEVVEDALREAIHDVISVGQFDFEQRVADADKPLVIVFTGVNGVGKTTTIAKLSRYLEERGFSSVLANGDTYRAGANEQIREHAAALDRRLIAHDQGGDPAAVLYDAVEYAEANDVDVVLGDTAGRLHTDEGLMDQLEKIDRVVGPDMAIFVDEAVAGQDAVNRAREFDAAAPFDGAVLTKADADSNGGAAISIAHVTGKPVLFLGTGQGYDDLERFDPDRMIDRLLGEE
ncbi:signal recognition particle-docking protein FtsY [Saliphagus infecundisoli]|uniref:Signal recognition particle receptor FtsY n=1 Tax=Saliphagus infecundisoli TaxID=1849069 RepID=A0ABD5QDB9_9EURY|nr:signal recognition particle-docking protein FtsY [Saliphagus infecundisoli]